MNFSQLATFLRAKAATVLLFFWFFLLSCHISTASAQESFAEYPPLPAGYSSIRVFDSHGRFAGRILPDKRYWVSIDRIPVFLQKALVAVEDSRFYEHGGIDIRGIARALVKDVAKGKLVEGGSTITQQLIKNKFLSGEKTLDRKIKEAKLAIEFEQKYSKRQILEMYFNEIYFGNGAWGIAQAARLYFDKKPEELNDAECSILAGIPKNPGRYNPLSKATWVTARRDVVLKRMVELKMISLKQQKYLRAHPPAVIPTNQASWYVSHVRSMLVAKFGEQIIDQGGLDITTAMDLKLQKLAERTLSDGVKKLSPQLQGALLCMDANNGDILAIAGGVDNTSGSFDRAFLAERQPGSAIKPLIYTAALEKGITAASIWDDTPVSYDRGNGEKWKPMNYGREEYGKLSLRQALAYSNNVVAVKLLDTIGVPYFVDYAGKLGLPLKPESGLSLALGSGEATLKEMVEAYAPLANGGSRPEARAIIRMYDRSRRTFTEVPPAVMPSISPGAAYVTTWMLKDVMTYGTAKSLAGFSRRHPSAGKTGTTDDYKDAWFIGYTPNMVTGVWVGYDKPRSLGKGFTGGAVSAPIWERFMAKALAARPSGDFTKPDTVVSLTIDPTNGFLARSACPEKEEDYFLAGTGPAEYCPVHGGDPVSPLPPAPEQVPGQPDKDGPLPNPDEGSRPE